MLKKIFHILTLPLVFAIILLFHMIYIYKFTTVTYIVPNELNGHFNVHLVGPNYKTTIVKRTKNFITIRATMTLNNCFYVQRKPNTNICIFLPAPIVYHYGVPNFIDYKFHNLLQSNFILSLQNVTSVSNVINKPIDSKSLKLFKNIPDNTIIAGPSNIKLTYLYTKPTKTKPNLLQFLPYYVKTLGLQIKTKDIKTMPVFSIILSPATLEKIEYTRVSITGHVDKKEIIKLLTRDIDILYSNTKNSFPNNKNYKIIKCHALATCMPSENPENKDLPQDLKDLNTSPLKPLTKQQICNLNIDKVFANIPEYQRSVVKSYIDNIICSTTNTLRNTSSTNQSSTSNTTIITNFFDYLNSFVNLSPFSYKLPCYIKPQTNGLIDSVYFDLAWANLIRSVLLAK